MSVEKVTVAVITHNGEKLLEECLSAIESQDYTEYEIMLVDDNSTDYSVELVKRKFPKVKVLQMKDNRGPNAARNAAIREADTRYVLLVDDDAVLTPDCLKTLMKAVSDFPEGALWSPRVTYYDRKDVIQFEGASLHFVGEAILNNPDTQVKEVLKTKPFSVDAAAGVTLLIDKKKALQVGLFDEDYFFGRTDGEFTFRLTISGFKCLSIPQALVYHKVKPRGLSKVFYQVRNRWYLILQTYSWKTIFIIIPALLIYEISVVLFLTAKGALSEYLRANLAVLKEFPRLVHKRRRVQALKKLSDRQVLHGGDFYLRGDLIEKKYQKLAKNLLNRTLNSYWKLVKNLM